MFQGSNVPLFQIPNSKLPRYFSTSYLVTSLPRYHATFSFLACRASSIVAGELHHKIFTLEGLHRDYAINPLAE